MKRRTKKKVSEDIVELLRYFLFGVLATLVDIGSFYILNSQLGMQYLLANAIAILLSILFAYVCNKRFVFTSHSESKRDNIKEFGKFISARLVTAVLDMLIMWALVDFQHVDENIAKISTQVVVAVLNYVFSKAFVFK